MGNTVWLSGTPVNISTKFNLLSSQRLKIKKEYKVPLRNTPSLAVSRCSQALDCAAPFQLKFHLRMKHPPHTHTTSHLGQPDLIPSCVTFCSGIPLCSPLIFPSASVKRKCTKSLPHLLRQKEKSRCVTRDLVRALCFTLEFHVVDFFCSLTNWNG